MGMTRAYESLGAAAKSVLAESASIANYVGLKYVVIGGWSSYLLNTGGIAHPGTKDVDLLFERGGNPGELQEVVAAFLRAGYLSSAKHPFQMLRLLKVGDREFVFNVDFLHHSPAEKVEDLFVDHLVLNDRVVSYSYQSIVVPMSTLLFSEASATEYSLTCELPVGGEQTINVPLMTEFGTILTKHKSMYGIKRTRDAFDVMLAIHQARDVAALAGHIRTNSVQDRLAGLWNLIDDATMRKNISRYWSDAAVEESWRGVVTSLEAFFGAAAINRAKNEEP
jgi:hypothetical protein